MIPDMEQTKVGKGDWKLWVGRGAAILNRAIRESHISAET